MYTILSSHLLLTVSAELRRQWFVDASQCSLQDADTSGKGRLSVHQAWSVFLVLAAGAAIATVVALLEVIYYKRFFSGELTD